MIDYESNTIRLNGNVSEIKEWAVWFHTPFGLCNDFKEAVANVKASDFPLLSIRPVPVAIGSQSGVYEPVF